MSWPFLLQMLPKALTGERLHGKGRIRQNLKGQDSEKRRACEPEEAAIVERRLNTFKQRVCEET